MVVTTSIGGGWEIASGLCKRPYCRQSPFENADKAKADEICFREESIKPLYEK